MKLGSRYEQLNELVAHYVPEIILETGTWRGDRAMTLANEVLKKRDTCHYIGYDLFKSGNPGVHVVEFNTKALWSKDEVAERLSKYAFQMAQYGKTFTFDLNEGDTKTTLDAGVKADFAYIDGGHSAETVFWDYECTIDIPVVVFDDYYDPDLYGKVPPKEYQGVNDLVRHMDKKGVRYKILASFDPVLIGGIAKLVWVDRKSFELPTIEPRLNVEHLNVVLSQFGHGVGNIKGWKPQ